ncbi:GPR161 (predicted) [Pycnogonum litorale]
MYPIVNNASNPYANRLMDRNDSARDFETSSFGHTAIEASGLALVAFVSILGNFIVALSLFKRQQLINPSNRLVFSLTASNFLFGVLVLPFAVVSRIQKQWVFGIFWCNVNGFITTLVTVASTLTIAVIAVDRYYAIVKPMIYTSKMTNTRAVGIIFGVWFHAFVCSTPPLMGWSRYAYQSDVYSCMIQWRGHRYYTCFFITICFIIPLSMMLICYYLIFQVARTQCAKITVGVLGKSLHEITPTLISATLQCPETTQASINFRSKPTWTVQPDTKPIKSIWTICIIFGGYVMPNVPFVVWLLIKIAFDHPVLPHWFGFWSHLLFYSSSANYFFVYGLYNRSIRKQIRTFVSPKSSSAFKGLPRTNTRGRLSRNVSLLDFSPFRLRPNLGSQSESIPHIDDKSGTSDVLFFWARKESIRKDSQDSGAVMTPGEISDNEQDTAITTVASSHDNINRCSSAPSLVIHHNIPHTKLLSSSRRYFRRKGAVEIHRIGGGSSPNRKFTTNQRDVHKHSRSNETIEEIDDATSVSDYQNCDNPNHSENSIELPSPSLLRQTDNLFVRRVSAASARTDDEGIEKDCIME